MAAPGIMMRWTAGGRSIVAAVALIATMPAPQAADAIAWTVDPANSSITFTGRQMGAPSKGRFKSFTAKVDFDPANLAASAVEATIDLASAETGNPDIDKELKQPKWFDVARFPTARFVTTLLRAKGDKRYEAVARLTIRDVTAEVMLPFTLEMAQDSVSPDLWLAHAVGDLVISRSKFGIGRDEWLDTTIVADAVTIRIDVVARRSK
jgi:polyisoprenoid-binding protein YceI